jgi:hypothetical protein
MLISHQVWIAIEIEPSDLPRVDWSNTWRLPAPFLIACTFFPPKKQKSKGNLEKAIKKGAGRVQVYIYVYIYMYIVYIIYMHIFYGDFL